MLRAKSLADKIHSQVELFKSLLPFTTDIQAVLDKKFRLEFNYNSNHLEGNTLTYSETELLLIFDQTDGGHEYREYQEMQAHDVALIMIQKEAEDKERPLTEQFIRTLNETLLVKEFWKDAITSEGQKTRKKIVPGAYKTTPNSVLLSNGEIFHYTSPADVANEMANLVEWFNTNKDQMDHIKLAATLHYRFVRIHPFDDGNGRTARLLMNYVLLSHQLPIIVIKTDEKKEYLAALNHADTGDIDYFIDYIGNELLWSLALSIKAGRGESIEEVDDLDKELELLIKQLNQVPDEYDKAKSKLETIELIVLSLFPLSDAISRKLSKISDLFVETTVQLCAIEHSFDGNLEEYIVNRPRIEQLHNAGKFSDEIIGLNFVIKLTALKKVVEPINISLKLSVHLEEYHYTLTEDSLNEILIKIPYGRYYSDDQIDGVVRNLMYKILSAIKSATKLQ